MIDGPDSNSNPNRERDPEQDPESLTEVLRETRGGDSERNRIPIPDPILRRLYTLNEEPVVAATVDDHDYNYDNTAMLYYRTTSETFKLHMSVMNRMLVSFEERQKRKDDYNTRWTPWKKIMVAFILFHTFFDLAIHGWLVAALAQSNLIVGPTAGSLMFSMAVIIFIIKPSEFIYIYERRIIHRPLKFPNDSIWVISTLIYYILYGVMAFSDTAIPSTPDTQRIALVMFCCYSAVIIVVWFINNVEERLKLD